MNDASMMIVPSKGPVSTAAVIGASEGTAGGAGAATGAELSPSGCTTGEGAAAEAGAAGD